MKKCSNCFKDKPLTDFYVKRKILKNGQVSKSRRHACKECWIEITVGYQYDRKVREGLIKEDLDGCI